MIKLSADNGGIELEGKGIQVLTIHLNQLALIPTKEKQNIRIVIVDNQTGFSSTSTL